MRYGLDGKRYRVGVYGAKVPPIIAYKTAYGLSSYDLQFGCKSDSSGAKSGIFAIFDDEYLRQPIAMKLRQVGFFGECSWCVKRWSRGLHIRVGRRTRIHEKQSFFKFTTGRIT